MNKEKQKLYDELNSIRRRITEIYLEIKNPKNYSADLILRDEILSLRNEGYFD